VILKEFENKKIYLASHNDLDGVMNVVVARYYLDYFCQSLTYQLFADKDFPDLDWKDIENADIIIFTDLAPTEIMCERLQNMSKEIIVCDHHATSNKYLNNWKNSYYFDNTRCGTKIFYDLLSEGLRKNRVLDEMVELTNIYDLWIDTSLAWKKALEFEFSLFGHVDWKRVLYSAFPPSETEKHEKFINICLAKAEKSKELFFTDFELKKIEEAKDKLKKQYEECKQKIQFRVDGQGNKYAFISAKTKVSLVANFLMKEYKEKVDYMTIWNTYEKDSLHISIRSLGNFDTTQISEIWGGGGHKAASAFNFKDRQKFDDFILGKIHLL